MEKWGGGRGSRPITNQPNISRANRSPNSNTTRQLKTNRPAKNNQPAQPITTQHIQTNHTTTITPNQQHVTTNNQSPQPATHANHPSRRSTLTGPNQTQQPNKHNHQAAQRTLHYIGQFTKHINQLSTPINQPNQARGPTSPRLGMCQALVFHVGDPLP